MTAYADLQFYRVDGDHVIKEFALVTVDSRVAHYVFEPPQKIESSLENLKNIDWVYRNHHGLHWDSGFVPYREAAKIITNSLSWKNDVFLVYVKGLEKMNFLKKLDIYALNIENYGLAYKIKEIKRGSRAHTTETKTTSAL